MKRKRPFVLLEVLFALTIVSLSFTLLILPHFTTAREEYKLACACELERIAFDSFLTVYEQHRNEKLTAEDFQEKHELTPVTFPLLGRTIVVERAYTFSFPEKQKSYVRPLDVEISLQMQGQKRQQYRYGMILECANAA